METFTELELATAKTDVKPVDISEVCRVSSYETYSSVSDASYEATIGDLIELLEDEEDIREGLKALAEEEGTISWEEYQRQRAERESRGELPT